MLALPTLCNSSVRRHQWTRRTHQVSSLVFNSVWIVVMLNYMTQIQFLPVSNGGQQEICVPGFTFA